MEACGVVGWVVLAVDEFEFEGAPEAFHGGVVIAVALAAHGGCDVCMGEGGSEVAAGILDAPIGVEQEAFGMVAVKESHGEGF